MYYGDLKLSCLCIIWTKYCQKSKCVNFRTDEQLNIQKYDMQETKTFLLEIENMNLLLYKNATITPTGRNLLIKKQHNIGSTKMPDLITRRFSLSLKCNCKTDEQYSHITPSLREVERKLPSWQDAKQGIADIYNTHLPSGN